MCDCVDVYSEGRIMRGIGCTQPWTDTDTLVVHNHGPTQIRRLYTTMDRHRYVGCTQPCTDTDTLVVNNHGPTQIRWLYTTMDRHRYSGCTQPWTDIDTLVVHNHGPTQIHWLYPTMDRHRYVTIDFAVNFVQIINITVVAHRACNAS